MDLNGTYGRTARSIECDSPRIVDKPLANGPHEFVELFKKSKCLSIAQCTFPLGAGFLATIKRKRRSLGRRLVRRPSVPAMSKWGIDGPE
jgi:hypothetical protein